MEQTWFGAASWPLVAAVAGLIANWLKISTALSEIVVGTVAQLAIGALAGGDALGAKAPWITFLAGTGASRGRFGGTVSWAHNVLGWSWRPRRLVGVTVSKPSVAVVYAVMLELGFNQTTYGKAILAACFINDLGTVLALDLVFSPFTKKTLLLPAISLVSLLILPFVTRWFFERYGPRIRTGDQVPLFLLFGPGSFAVWSGSEAVLPACIIGMVRASCAGNDHFLILRPHSLPPELCRGQSRRLVFGGS